MDTSRFDKDSHWPEALTPDRERHSARSEKLFAEAAIALSLRDVALSRARWLSVLFAPPDIGVETNIGVRIALKCSMSICTPGKKDDR
ncbi:hypothetical protein BE61_44910 [Bradyrhizobium elkanii USDA 61]|nr:hypothetical protein BE61_44910 [Bradyrhizobium elkanii USDA 61]